MMDCTDRHDRFFLRLMSKNVMLYTEMVATKSAIHGDRKKILSFSPEEKPLALQVGGSNKEELAEVAKIAEDMGYDEININLGCPSKKVQKNKFGACLIKEPDLVAECINSMVNACRIPVTAKTRIGFDDTEEFDYLNNFIHKMRDAGSKIFILHARKAILTGLSPKQYAMAVRKQRFRDELKSSKTVTQTIYEAGYDSPSRAYADNATSGLMPSKYKKGAQGEKIRYAHRETSLGSILVAATDRGICLVEFVEKEEALSVLKVYFPSAELQEDATDWKEWISEVVAQIDDPHRRQSNDMALPLDIRGTVFQEKVWRALTEIPSGKTLSYTQLAQSLGQPNAARAVARACASNHLAVLVPCHRVIRESGDLAGYKWGLERKQQLLEQEAEDQ